MKGQHISNDEFFAQLPALFAGPRKNDSGSVFLTQKRLSYGMPEDVLPLATADRPFSDMRPTKPVSIIVRASSGHKEEKNTISTIVEAGSLESFFIKYADLCKGEMQGLKKRDRSKLKAKLKAKKKKSGPTA